MAVAAIIFGLAPTPAFAHVKWFVEPKDAARPKVDWSLVFSSRTALLLAVAAGALAVLYVAQKLVRDPHWPALRSFERMAIGAPTLLAVQAAITLIYAAAQPALFVPNIPLPINAFGVVVAAVEILIAFSFITGILDVVGAIALMVLWPISLFRGRYFDTLDMLFWVSIGLTILFVGAHATDVARIRPWFRSHTKVSSAGVIAALRVITGLAVLAPALSEKIWNPRLANAFLAQYPQFNFMQSVFGLSWFNHDRFVLAAGVAEGTIGVLLISGLLTRVVILGMWLPFNIGIAFLPAQELIGHLPILGIMYLLLVHSSGIAPGESLDRRVPPGAPKQLAVSNDRRQTQTADSWMR